VGWIPGWDSIAGASWWSAFWFWASILSLIGLGIAEVASHRYGTRKDDLAAIEEAAKDKRHEEDMARVQHETAQANERAAVLEKDAEEARLSIAAANARAAEAELQLAQLRKPRSLEVEPQDRVTQSIKGFANTPFLISVFDDPETIGLLSQIESALSAAAWVEKPWKYGNIQYTRPNRPSVGLNTLSGIFVQVDTSRQSDLGAAGNALAYALKNEGLEARFEIGAMPDWMDKNAVQIQLGQKPR
jgi:hypothetical protein